MDISNAVFQRAMLKVSNGLARELDDLKTRYEKSERKNKRILIAVIAIGLINLHSCQVQIDRLEKKVKELKYAEGE